MLGWEFPPFISGGLGTACYGLTRALSSLGAAILFVLPRPVTGSHASHVRLLSPLEESAEEGKSERRQRTARDVRMLAVNAALSPYDRPAPQRPATAKTPLPARTRPQPAPRPLPGQDYGGDLFAEVRRYARLVARLALDEEFDVIHAHDWITYPAAAEIAARTGKPLVVHVHSTEFDRSGHSVDPRIHNIERAGVRRANAVITVSRLTRQIVTSRYTRQGDKVTVVYNGIDLNGAPPPRPVAPGGRRDKTVLFMGRITRQKGPEYFLAAARRVLDQMPDVRFIMAGSGDKLRRSIDMAAEMGIAGRVVFTGFLRGADVERVFRMASVFVMPSVSEPFGLVPLEALSHGVPVIISKQSGVAEVLDHALKVNFWDVEDMAAKIVSVLSEPDLGESLAEQGRLELAQLTWDAAARRCMDVYRSVVQS